MEKEIEKEVNMMGQITTDFIKNVSIKVPISDKKYKLIEFNNNVDGIWTINETEEGIIIIFNNGRKVEYRYMQTEIEYYSYDEYMKIRNGKK